jgi:hypothetical protein
LTYRETIMTDREVRIAHTEALFRDVNERIAESAERFNSDEAEFICECADQTCTERVGATLDEYEQVREQGDTFLLVPGHEDTSVERVVERPRNHLAIVRKVNAVVARTVRRLDPRAQAA